MATEVITGPAPATREGRSTTGLPAAAFGLLLLIAWLATGVRLSEALLFAGYEVVYVLLPGVLLHGCSAVALSPRWIGWRSDGLSASHSRSVPSH